MIKNIIGNKNKITLVLDVGTDLGSLDGSFDYSNYGKLVGLLLGDSLKTTYGKVLGTILGNVDAITFGLDVGTDMGSLDVSFDGSNDDKREGLLI